MASNLTFHPGALIHFDKHELPVITAWHVTCNECLAVKTSGQIASPWWAWHMEWCSHYPGRCMAPAHTDKSLLCTKTDGHKDVHGALDSSSGNYLAWWHLDESGRRLIGGDE